MPTPLAIGSMATYTNRDTIVKKGCSTVDLVGGKYQVQDFVTTYHPLGELPPQFRYCRNLMLDWNVRYGYFLLEQINVVDHVIADDNDTVRASRVIKPKQWKALLFQYADDLTLRGLVVQPTFMQESITVSLSTSNPDRLEVFFRYKRSGVARIVSTVAEAGFNFGTL
jgi:phage tail sheath gpL-like